MSSDDDDDDNDDDFDVGGNEGNLIEDLDDSDGVEEEDDGRHLRMLQGITGMSNDAFEGKTLWNIHRRISMRFTDKPSSMTYVCFLMVVGL